MLTSRNASIMRRNHFSAYDLTKYRTILSVKGPDSDNYLQNLITNDIRLLSRSDNAPRSIYAMILNNRGRVMYDVMVYKNVQNVEAKEFLIEIDSGLGNEAFKLFKMLKVKKKVKLDDMNFKALNTFNISNTVT